MARWEKNSLCIPKINVGTHSDSSKHLDFYSFSLGYTFGFKLWELRGTNPIKFFAFREIINKHLGMNLWNQSNAFIVENKLYSENVQTIIQSGKKSDAGTAALLMWFEWSKWTCAKYATKAWAKRVKTG
jgi:hypothetical protein